MQIRLSIAAHRVVTEWIGIALPAIAAVAGVSALVLWIGTLFAERRGLMLLMTIPAAVAVSIGPLAMAVLFAMTAARHMGICLIAECATCAGHALPAGGRRYRCRACGAIHDPRPWRTPRAAPDYVPSAASPTPDALASIHPLEDS